jgi:hypothetical protein
LGHLLETPEERKEIIQRRVVSLTSVGRTAEHAESAEDLRISATSALSAVRNKANLPANTAAGDHPKEEAC